MSDFPVSHELWSVAETALDYGAQLAADRREPFQPALVSETAGGERSLTQLVLVGELGNDPLASALAMLRERAEVVRAAIVVDGYTHINEVQEDALLVFVGERGASTSHQFAQRYRRRGLRKSIREDRQHRVCRRASGDVST